MIYNKVEYFRQKLQYFLQSEKGVIDFMEFIQACHKVLAQGDGLVWSQIRDVLEQEIKQ